MKNLQLHTNPDVETKFETYPEAIKERMMKLRNLIIETAEEIEDVKTLEETLKWGEPSYLTKHGSTLRIDWKGKTPDQYAMYFKCTSKLVPTFKACYQDAFTFEGSRAIIFKLDESIQPEKLKKCIAATLQYHKVKQLPLLGM